MKPNSSGRLSRFVAFPAAGMVCGAFIFVGLLATKIVHDPFRRFDFLASIVLVISLALPATLGLVMAILNLVEIESIQRAFSRVTYTARLFTWVGIVSGLFMYFRPGGEGLAILGLAAIALPCIGALLVGSIFPIVFGLIGHVLGLVLGFGLVFVEVLLDFLGETIARVAKRLVFAVVFGFVLGVWFFLMASFDSGGVPSNGFFAWDMPRYIFVLCRPGFILSCAFTGWLVLVFSQRPDLNSKLNAIYNVYGFLVGTILGVLFQMVRLPINYLWLQILASCLTGILVVLLDLRRDDSKPKTLASGSSIFATRAGRLLFNVPMLIFLCILLGLGFHMDPQDRKLLSSLRLGQTHKFLRETPDLTQFRVENRTSEETLESVEFVTVLTRGNSRVFRQDGLSLGPHQSYLFTVQDPDLKAHYFQVFPRAATFRPASIKEQKQPDKPSLPIKQRKGRRPE